MNRAILIGVLGFALGALASMSSELLIRPAAAQQLPQLRGAGPLATWQDIGLTARYVKDPRSYLCYLVVGGRSNVVLAVQDVSCTTLEK